MRPRRLCRRPRCRHRHRRRRPSSSPTATGARRGQTAWMRPAPPPCAPTPPPCAATPASAFAVAIPLHCIGHQCGVVVVRLCCHHWFVLPSPETASVGELSAYSNVVIFLKVLCTGIFFKFCGKRIKLFSRFKLFLSNLVIQIVSHKSASVSCCLMIHHTRWVQNLTYIVVVKCSPFRPFLFWVKYVGKTIPVTHPKNLSGT